MYKKCELDRNDQQYEKIRFQTIVEVNIPILGDGGKIVVHNVTKNLEMFTLATYEWIRIHHEKVSLTNLDRWYKSQMKTSVPLANLIKALTTSNNGTKHDNASNVWKSQRRLRFNLAWTTLMLSCDIFIITRRNLVICNHSFCNYMQLCVGYDYIWFFLH